MFNTNLAWEVNELYLQGLHWAAIDRELGLNEGRSRQVWAYGRENGTLPEPLFSTVRKKVDIRKALIC